MSPHKKQLAIREFWNAFASNADQLPKRLGVGMEEKDADAAAIMVYIVLRAYTSGHLRALHKTGFAPLLRNAVLEEKAKARGINIEEV